jgi:deoxyribodipyrimidine photo-lyase
VTTIVWFRLDLRLADNPALDAALKNGGEIVPVFIHAPEEEEPWAPGAASRWWLHQSLRALDEDLRKRGSRLVIRRGPTLAGLSALVSETSADAVFWNRRYEPAVIARDAAVKAALLSQGVSAVNFNAALLHEPWTVRNQSGKPFQVFTPFWRNCLSKPDPAEPLSWPKHLGAPKKWPRSLALKELKLEPRINWAQGLKNTWQPGERGATANLRCFLAESFDDYSEQRNWPGFRGTSRLSPHLHFGEISPRQVWHDLSRAAARRKLPIAKWRHSQFLAELGWREFAHHLLYHFPHTPAEPLRPEFRNFPWRRNEVLLRAWQRGRTGYPIVDAGMRELWTTGWMHNRVRMIVASFLVKDLLLSWQEGARWFWDTLVDADLAQNTLGWQWTTGCGADAAPYFRVFNPQSQSEKFDPDGNYIRRWCPELATLPDKWMHQPAATPVEVFEKSGVRLGHNYPAPVISHTIAREVALEAFSKIKRGSKR